ncbi:hypothetical protein FB468_2615 [Leucobacter komagatae]|uniref:Alkylmercury lyase n=1 Tax=Leucobacter komagatae TaxID=55969 RepID=A0A542Y8Z4_9MICO|nr:hypothetical protein [Leucobacter komagatae]TQL44555.1 hypothetical protein FB468_2615 [Leucobacter komagatae]
MKAQVLVIHGCPSAGPATENLRAALAVVGTPETPIETVTISSNADAEGVSFSGSPTILIDGEDLFAGATRTRELSCRVYATAGGLSGWPSIEAIAAALRERRPRK